MIRKILIIIFFYQIVSSGTAQSNLSGYEILNKGSIIFLFHNIARKSLPQPDIYINGYSAWDNTITDYFQVTPIQITSTRGPFNGIWASNNYEIVFKVIENYELLQFEIIVTNVDLTDVLPQFIGRLRENRTFLVAVRNAEMTDVIITIMNPQDLEDSDSFRMQCISSILNGMVGSKVVFSPSENPW